MPPAPLTTGTLARIAGVMIVLLVITVEAGTMLTERGLLGQAGPPLTCQEGPSQGPPALPYYQGGTINFKNPATGQNMFGWADECADNNTFNDYHCGSGPHSLPIDVSALPKTVIPCSSCFQGKCYPPASSSSSSSRTASSASSVAQSAGACSQNLDFVLRSWGEPVSFSYSPVSGDFNRDGKQDLVLINARGNGYRAVYAGQGNGTFSEMGSDDPLVFMGAGDFNRDGIPDLVGVGGSVDGGIDVFLAQQGGTFRDRENYPGEALAGTVLVHDVSADGKVDVLVARARVSDGVQLLSVWLGLGDGTFQAERIQTLPIDPSSPGSVQGDESAIVPLSIAIADFTGDRKQDLAVLHETDGLGVYAGNNQGSFALAEMTADIEGRGMETGEFNGDGNADLVITSAGAAGTQVFLGNGDGTFAQVPCLRIPGSLRDPLVVDLNGDRKADILYRPGNNFGGPGTQPTDHLSAVLGKGDGTFTAPIDISDVPAISEFSVGDFNADALPDLTVITFPSGWPDAQAHILMNTICRNAVFPNTSASDPSCSSSSASSSTSSASSIGYCGPVCGDNIVMSPEQCDYGSKNSDIDRDACRTDCRKAHCGDGVQDTGEDCDDGNQDDTDACSSTCIDVVITASSSSSSSSSSAASIAPQSLCGNGRREAGEQCDDGNRNSGDGCDSSCRQEQGWQCVAGTPVSSAPSSSAVSSVPSAGSSSSICPPPPSCAEPPGCTRGPPPLVNSCPVGCGPIICPSSSSSTSSLACTDSDGGENPTVAGFTTIAGIPPRYDQCFPYGNPGNVLAEAVCEGNLSFPSNVTCGAGLACVNGFCATPAQTSAIEQKCRDSDKGYDVTVRGTVTLQDGSSQQDTCTNGTFTEWYCNGENAFSLTGVCGNGCGNGTCNP